MQQYRNNWYTVIALLANSSRNLEADIHKVISFTESEMVVKVFPFILSMVEQQNAGDDSQRQPKTAKIVESKFQTLNTVQTSPTLKHHNIP